jgi:hypothetical protein
MWLAVSSIVVASAIGFNVLALWLTGWFGRKQPVSAFIKSGTRTQTYLRDGHQENGCQISSDTARRV